MAISHKPQKATPPAPPPQVSEEEVQRLIKQGGSVAKASAPADPVSIKPQLVQLRLYRDVIEDIDAVRTATAGKKRPPSRHAWIVKAIEEKLERDRK